MMVTVSFFLLNFCFGLPNLLQLATVIHLIMENLYKVIVIRDRTWTENRGTLSAPFFEGSFKAPEVSKKAFNEGKPQRN